MSGDIKVRELVSRARTRRSFDVDLAEIRAKHGIQVDGYRSEADTTGWLVARGAREAEFVLEKDPKVLHPVISFDDDLTAFLHKYDLPSSARFLVRNLILNNGTIEMGSNALCAVDNMHASHDHWLSEEAQWRERGERYARILVDERASKADVLEFVRKNWGSIRREILGGTPKKQRRIRSMKNRDRDALILRYWEQSAAELDIKPHDRGKDIVVARLLRNHGYPEVTPEIVRKVVSVQKKLRDL